MSASNLRPAWHMPVQWPRATDAPGNRHALTSARVLKAAIVFALLALTALDRFGLRLSADYSIPPGLVAMYGLVAAMALAGVAQLNARGALAYLGIASVAALSFMVNASVEQRPYVSITSFLLLMVLYAPFAFSFADAAAAPKLWRWTVNLYIGFMVLMAAAGIVQFFAQLVFKADWLFDYTALIPEPIRASGGWNTVYSTGPWIKSNGFFLREPSMFSIAMAFALLCELSLARRKWVMAILALALVLSYSGSGLLCLAVGMLFPLGGRSLLRVLACAAVAAAVYLVFGDALNLSYTLERVDEINHERSSAYCRFIYPGAMALQQLDSNVWATLLGNGPGSMVRMGGTCADLHQPTYAKLLFEYGLAGTLAFGALIFVALNRSAAPIRIRAALALTWLLLGGNLLASEVLLVIYLLSAMWPEPAR
jgi:hypothetical protein